MPDSASNSVPFLDVGATYEELRTQIDNAIAEVLDSGWFLLGSQLEAFESEFADYVETEHAVGVGSGLDALTLALRALDIGPDDEVVVPSNTYIATWLAVSAVGATPIPVEPDPGTHNIDVTRIEAALTSRTKAILPVHLYGQPADLGPLLDLGRTSGCAIVEDAAQAHGARYQGRRIGGIGDVTCWSFYPGKNLGAFGDGGAVTTNNGEVAERVRVLRNYGSREKYVNEVRGVNSRLDEIQAAVLRVKLRHLDAWTARRVEIASHYLQAFADVPSLKVPQILPGVESAWHLFVVRHARREALRAHLTERGVQTLIHYPIPPHRQAAYADLTIASGLPIASRLASEVLSLPIGPHLDLAHARTVADALHEWLREER